MITKKTVFILGSGASRPYGVMENTTSRRIIRNYPTGRELYNRVRDYDSHYGNLLEAFGGESAFYQKYDEDFHSYVDGFVQLVNKADVGSIDFFINENKKYTKLGKMLIAMMLIDCEDENGLYHDNADNWYRYLVELIRAPRYEQMFDNNVSFATFNYDRSLELYLYNHFSSLYSSRGKDDVMKLFNNYKIHHLYGDIGLLPFQSTGEMKTFKYSLNDQMVARYNDAVNSIHLIDEDRTTAEFEVLNKMLKNAELVCFLGFGFDEVNLKKIEEGSLLGKQVLYSGYRLPEQKNSEMHDYFMRMKASVPNFSEKYNDMEIVSFLKKYFPVKI
jgi:hypothetical protein